MADIACILHCGIYEVLVEYLDYDDVYELALVNSEWGSYLGGSFARYWQKASTEMFGLRFDLARILYNGMIVGYYGGEPEKESGERRGCVDQHGRVKSWFAYFEFLKTSELRRFLVSQRKTNKFLQSLLSNLKADLSFVNSRFALQNSASLDGEVCFVKSVQEYGRSTASSREVSVVSRSGGKYGVSAGPTSFDRVELDFGGLGRGYLWDMEVVVVTSQNVVLRSELHVDDIPHWDTGQQIMEYIAVWGLVGETNHVLLYHHRNPFHRAAGGDRAQPGGYGSRVPASPGRVKILDLKGIHYFLSSLASFAGIEMNFNEALSKMTVYVTLQVVVILDNLRSRHLLSGIECPIYSRKKTVSVAQNSEVCRPSESLKEDEVETGDGHSYWRGNKMSKDQRSGDLADFEWECGRHVSTQKSLFFSEGEEGNILESCRSVVTSSSLQHKDQLESCSRDEPDGFPEEGLSHPGFGRKPGSAPPRLVSSRCVRSHYNIELQLMDTRASIPLYLYGDLEPASGGDSGIDFAKLRVCFGRKYPSSSLIKTNCLYQAGISVIDKSTGEVVFSLIFPKSKSYYDRRMISKSKRLLKLCSYSRVYGTQVPMVDPPSRLASMPESILSKLEILIYPQKSPAVGKVSELSVSLNVQECLALFPARKFTKFLRLQGLHSHDHQHKRRVSSSPIKSIQKH